MKQARFITALMILAITASAAGRGFAQEPPKQEKPRPARPAQKPAPQTEIEAIPETSEEAMRRTLTTLADQIGALTTEVQKLRLETERSSLTLELLLNEERLGRVEEKLEAALDFKTQLDAREQEIQRRLKNVQQEAMLRGGLRREETENAIRAELQRALEDTRNQQSAYQQRVSELQAQANRLRQRVETTRRRLEPAEGSKQ
jgi:uncharacterized protein involved in exopolysaccharide biosynthesis